LTELSPAATYEVRHPMPGCAMLNLILKCSDSIETILPTVELAMHSGDVCRLHNINYLGRIHLVALTLLATSESLMDSVSGQVVHPHPGYCLLGIDERGVTQTLAR
jgi:hypothetical protein